MCLPAARAAVPCVYLQHGLEGLLAAHAAGMLDLDGAFLAAKRGTAPLGRGQEPEPTGARFPTLLEGRQAARPPLLPVNGNPGSRVTEWDGHSNPEAGVPSDGKTTREQQLIPGGNRQPQLGQYGHTFTLKGAPHTVASPALGQGHRGQEAESGGLPQLGGKLLLGNVLFGPVESNACGVSTRKIERMPELWQLQPPSTELGANPGRLAAQATAVTVERHHETLLCANTSMDGTTHTHHLADTIVGGVLMSLGARAPLTSVTSVVEAVIWGAAEPLIGDLTTALMGPVGLSYTQWVADRLTTKLQELLAPLTTYSATYDADVHTVSNRLATLLGGLEMADCVLGLLNPHHPQLDASQRAWLLAAESELTRSAICDASMTEEMWAKGFGPQLGCLWRLLERVDEMVKLLRPTLAAAKFHSGWQAHAPRIAPGPRAGSLLPYRPHLLSPETDLLAVPLVEFGFAGLPGLLCQTGLGGQGSGLPGRLPLPMRCNALRNDVQPSSAAAVVEACGEANTLERPHKSAGTTSPPPGAVDGGCNDGPVLSDGAAAADGEAAAVVAASSAVAAADDDDDGDSAVSRRRCSFERLFSKA
ncbi:hypothetical protein VOLCADRAFT_91790 [Volvox carteri f. nagariensis]|uniref:Uncharacterized protein n=1 Tax=Volvox carteri f. nagariensis TaxID=3068 RepID=D8TXY8_VOLCA|nr:uncharacterized protein VOLCADRAFT_91790 [Volvox carteri f. nagariensis]EFJ47806.1 hypothetical protein VOLCADRAFT_91790 [Volvox carteri f. nagariensis]|eukprot:XP_002951277.1 hypothetical protein VOLCADRAFT_91790 [Volvox carteri f. nagariensis]